MQRERVQHGSDGQVRIGEVAFDCIQDNSDDLAGSLQADAGGGG